MSSYKLLNVYEETEEDVEFGTCDLCFSIGPHHMQFVELQNLSTGEIVNIEMGEWSWGDYFDNYLDDTLDILAFAEFLPNYKRLPEEVEDITSHDIQNAVEAFKNYEIWLSMTKEEAVMISKREYEKLKDSENFLNILHSNGVHSKWSGYDLAYKEYKSIDEIGGVTHW